MLEQSQPRQPLDRSDASDPSDPTDASGPAVAHDPPARPAAVESRLAPLGDRVAMLRRSPVVGALAVALVALGAGALWFRLSVAEPTAAAPIVETPGDDPGSAAATSGEPAEPEPTTTTVPSTVVVHVAGAVAQPGVVSLEGGSRVVDAIDAAGGAREEADLDRLNLAAVLADGQRVLVAEVGDPPTPALPQGGADAAEPTSAAPLDLNHATAAQLEGLPGIGPALAAAIVEERERRGGFNAVAQLRDVSGIGEQTLAEIYELVTV